jgi:amino acid transporter
VPKSGHGFGTSPVFLASISTILGAILFLRFGYAVGHQGLMRAILIVVLGHAVTVPTALALAEIATNRKVEGGGEYFIISRSFGLTVGGAIGIALYLSQTLSIAFYMIAFAEAFQPLAPLLESLFSAPFDPRMVSIPATVILIALVLIRGADVGVQALWVVVAILGVSLAMFFLGSEMPEASASTGLLGRIENPDPFFVVFAIVFPGFTGMTAGVGLSGDLANPRRSIPVGVMSATAVGFVVYLAAAFKLAASAPPDLLAEDPLIMARVAWWGPIIPIGLACATLSSAIGSVLVAPRTLQALGHDRVLPLGAASRFLAHGHGATNEPRNATLITAALVLVTVMVGNIDFVARMVSMFFMVTYGALCSISTVEHFAARPGYRPSFRSRWYLSVIGAVLCFLLMFQMDPVYAVFALAAMASIYFLLRKTRPDDVAALMQAALTQLTNRSQLKLQTTHPDERDWWRPSVIMVNARTFTHAAPLKFFGWLCHRYGFGTYLHFIEGMLNDKTYQDSRKLHAKLLDHVHLTKSVVYVDTIISPSKRSAVAQALQLPGVSGMENNTILFEFKANDEPKVLDEIADGFDLATAVRMNTLVLRHTERFFGTRATLHVWLTWHDYRNANLMILLSYILMGHPDWANAQVQIFAAYPKTGAGAQGERLREMVAAGRLPLSAKNLEVIPTTADTDFDRLVQTRSADADLTIMGFTEARLEQKGVKLLGRYPALQDVLFVCAQQQLLIE